MNIIEVKQVSKVFCKIFERNPILQNVNFTVQQGEFVVLRGENGSGKTTLLNLILGLLKPSSGEVKLMGFAPQNANSKTSIGVVLQDTQVPQNVKVKELVDLLRSYYPNPLSTEEILNKVKLKDKENAWATDLSGGQKQRLYFALALAGNPQLLILDEPTRNLDDKGYEEFWNQIKLCRQQGITILMVTNNKSDWDELNALATRCVTLHSITQIPPEGQLTEEAINLQNQSLSESSAVTSQINSLPNISSQNWQRIFLQQFWFETVQLLRTPLYLVGIFILAGIVPILKLIGLQAEDAKMAVINWCIVILFTIVLQRLSERIAIERAERWLKLLRVTPLPTAIYIISKILTSLSLCTVVLLLMFWLGNWQLKIGLGLNDGLVLATSFLLGIVPFAIFSFGLGYLIEPKSINGILALILIITMATSGIASLPGPQILQDLIALSPSYHYKELIFWAAHSNPNNHIFLHLLWLLWAWGAFGLFAVWSYQRDRVVQ